MDLSRRALLCLLAAGGSAAVARPVFARATAGASDQTAALQAEIDAAAPLGRPVLLPPGDTVTGPLVLRPGTVLSGHGPSSRLVFKGGGAVLTARNAVGIRLSHFAIDAAFAPLAGATAAVAISGCDDIAIDGVSVRRVAGHGISITASTGRVERSTVEDAIDTGLFALDSRLSITGNAVSGCGNNGILVWRSASGEDGSRVSGNRITKIRSDGGGSGQNGNGVNVFRAGGVAVSGNTITDCAYSAVRGNAASDISITGNTCQRIGEVAIYSEFGFEGALIANNLVDRAATGISVTNFNEGGRLAVVQGNLVRNLFLRSHEPVDTRGHGICVEADAAVSGNTVEGAPAAGILVGWGRYMRDVAVTGNVVRASRSGILVSSDAAAGQVLVSGNLISGAKDGAIRAHNQGRAFGPDLVREPTTGRVTITGNTAG